MCRPRANHAAAAAAGAILASLLSIAGCPKAGGGAKSAAGGDAAPPAWLSDYSPAQRSFIAASAALPPKGKEAALHAAPPEGLSVAVSQEQLDMLADTSPQFSPPARLERGIAECRHAIAGASLPPGLSNAAYLWGGTRAPDPFLVAAVADGKIVARPYEPAAGLMEKLEAFVEKGEDGGGGAAACAELDAMIAADPAMPLLNYLASGCRQAAGDEGGARAHVERELALNPAHPESLLAAASFLFHDGKTAEATRAAALAAAFWPAWDMPGKLLAAVPGAPCVAAGRAFDPEILVETNLHGAVLAAAPDGEPWLAAYARCRAAMRYCPEARMSFGMKAAPAAPGLVEEMACLTVAAGAGGGASPQLAFLREARDLGWLMEFALVEVIGAHRPDYLKFLPAAVKGSILDYVVAMRLQGAGGGPCTALEGKE